MRPATLLVAVMVPAVAAATWHVARQPLPPPAAMAVAAEPGWAPDGPARRWKCVVIHHSATEVGGADRFDREHRAKGLDELGYHFVVGNGSDTGDGQVEVGPRWSDQRPGAHTRTDDGWYDENGIGVCLVGDFDHHPPSRAQVFALRRLVRFLCRQYNIPADHVYAHADVTGKTRCPGQHFDLTAVRAAVR